MNNIIPLGACIMGLGILIMFIWGALRPNNIPFSKIDVYFLMGIVFSFISGAYLLTLECKPYC